MLKFYLSNKFKLPSWQSLNIPCEMTDLRFTFQTLMLRNKLQNCKKYWPQWTQHGSVFPTKLGLLLGCLGDTAGGVCPLHGWIQRQRPGWHFWQVEGGCKRRKHQKAQMEWKGHGQPGKYAGKPLALTEKMHRLIIVYHQTLCHITHN